MAAGNRANDNGGVPGSYELGDLEIVPSRPSAAQPRAALPGAPGMAQPVARVGTPRTLTLADEDDGPSLELDVAPVQARASARSDAAIPPARPAPPGARGAAAGSALAFSLDEDDDDLEGGFANLPSLDTQPVAPRSAARVVARDSTPDDPRTREQREAQRVADLADYGEVPKGWIASVSYAARVARRMLKLRRERDVVRAELEERRLAHHAALVALGQRLMERSQEPRFEPLRNQLAQVLEERSKVARAGDGVAQARGESERLLAELEQQVAAQQQKLSPLLTAEREAEAAKARVDEQVRRAQAMQKRAEIELRGLSEATQPDPSRGQALQEQLAQRRAAVEELAPLVTQANEALGRSRREVSLEQGALDVLKERQGQLQRAGRAREAEAEGLRKAADGAHDQALRALAEAARAHKLSAALPDAEARVADREQQQQESCDNLVRFDRALALYDRGAVRKGVGLVLLLVMAAVAVIVLR